MTLCNWLRRVFVQKTSNLESTTAYRTTKEDFGIYPTRNRSLIFILRTTPHPCQCFRTSEIRNSSAAGILPVLAGVHVAWRSALAFQSCHFVFVPGVEIHSLQLVSL